MNQRINSFIKKSKSVDLSDYQKSIITEYIAIGDSDYHGGKHSGSDAEHKGAEYIAEKVTVCRVLVNQICSTMNGGSFSNSFTPTTTLGCGSWGNNSISENFGYRNLLNITPIGYDIGGSQPDDDEIWGTQ